MRSGIAGPASACTVTRRVHQLGTRRRSPMRIADGCSTYLARSPERPRTASVDSQWLSEPAELTPCAAGCPTGRVADGKGAAASLGLAPAPQTRLWLQQHRAISGQ